MLSINKMISQYNHYNGNNIQYIILHYTGNSRDTAKANANYFNGGDRSASSHFFIDEDSIWQSVEECNGAWHIGNTTQAPNNRNSIGIEMCCSGDYQVSETTENNAIELVKYLMNKYGISISNVWSHKEVTRGGENKNCPNWDTTRWSNFKNKVIGQTINTPSNESIAIPMSSKSASPTQLSPIQKAKEFVGNRCLELQKLLIAKGYNCGEIDGIMGQKTYSQLVQYQKDNGLVSDGLAGTLTFAKLNEVVKATPITPTPQSNSYNWIAKLQSECNAQGLSNQKVDGYSGQNTLSGCPTLKVGSQGNITKLLQEKLGIDNDGIFGNGTLSSVIAYQNANGLGSDGIVGRNTWRKLLGL